MAGYLLRHSGQPGVVGAGGLPHEPTPVRNVWTCAMLVKRSAFEVVGGFREDFGKIGSRSLSEDTDLCLRVAAAQGGGQWIRDPARVMKHRVPAGRATFGYLMSRCYYAARTDARGHPARPR